MEAIDFARLRQQERQKARQRRRLQQKQADDDNRNSQQQDQATSNADTESCTPWPPWNGPPLTAQDVQTLNPSQHVLSRQPPSVYYIPNFLSSSDDDLETALVTWLQALPEVPPQQSTNNNTNNATADTAYRQALGKWTTLRYAARRVALFDARLQALPAPLLTLVQLLQHHVWERVPTSPNATRGPINHILINEYTEMQGILGHTDGPAYEPCTLTLSLASQAVLHFEPILSTGNNNDGGGNDDNYSQQPTPCCERQVWLQANSLVIFTQDLYQHYRHAIRDKQPTEHLTETAWNGTVGQAVQRGPLRYSLTFRCKRGQDE